jgi:hypothetical protein
MHSLVSENSLPLLFRAVNNNNNNNKKGLTSKQSLSYVPSLD